MLSLMLFKIRYTMFFHHPFFMSKMFNRYVLYSICNILKITYSIFFDFKCLKHLYLSNNRYMFCINLVDSQH